MLFEGPQAFFFFFKSHLIFVELWEINIIILIFHPMKMMSKEVEGFAQIYTAGKWQTQVTQEMKEKDDLMKKTNNYLRS